jgi:hypothetical protein
MTDDEFKAHVLQALEDIRTESAATRADVRTLTGMVKDLADAQLEDHEDIRRVKETIHPPASNGTAE